MATTGITVALQAVDQTAAAFGSAQSRFAAFSQSLTRTTARVSVFTSASRGIGAFANGIVTAHRAMIALAAAAGRLAAPIRNVVAEMHELSDRAQESGSSVSDLQSLSLALQRVGARGADVGSLATMLGRMRKATGDLGTEGFMKHMNALAAMNDETKRAEELTRIFGRTGMQLEFLLRRGPEAFSEGLRAAQADIGRLSDASIKTCSDVDKGFSRIKTDIRQGWSEMVAGMIEKWTGDFGGNVELGMALAWEDFKAWCRKMTVHLGTFLADFGQAFYVLFTKIPVMLWKALKTMGGTLAEFGKQIWGAITGDGFDSSAITARFRDGMADIGSYVDAEAAGLTNWDRVGDDMVEQIDIATEQAKDLIRKRFAKIDAITGVGTSIEDSAEEAADSLGGAASKISNALNPATWMDAAGYAARTLGMAARNALGGAAAAFRSGASSAAGRGAGGGASPSSALASIRPLVSQILDAVRENGRTASSFFNTMSALEAV